MCMRGGDVSLDTVNEADGVSRRKALSWGVAGLAISTVGLTSCSAAARSAVFNPATTEWLKELASSVAATQIEKALDGGLEGIWNKWSGSTDKTVDKVTAGQQFWYSAWAHQVPPVIMLSLSKSKQFDPMADRLVACVNSGKQAVVFDPWAWQALSMFVHDLTHEKTGSDLAMVQSLCLLTLIPSGVAPQTGGSPGGTVDWMTYQARNGAVEIAKISEPDGSMSAIITADGIPDVGNKPMRKKFTLPTEVAES